VMPLTLALVFTLIGLFYVWRGRRGPSFTLLLAALLILWAASSPPVASRLLWSLEKQYPPVPLNAIPVSDCIIVLGGVVGAAARPRVDIELYESVDRVYQTAKLFREGRGKTVIVAAGNQPWNRNQIPEAERIRDLLVEWGVAPDAIALDSFSKNTRENALNAAVLASKLDCESNLLVTTGWHMPRAVATFQKAGLRVLPISVDVQGIGETPAGTISLLPSTEALSATSLALREWLGIWVYRWRGWN